jgi:hypothetical protein
MVASEKRALRLTQTPKGSFSIDFREVWSILDAMDAPTIDEYVLFSFQKILHRGESGSSVTAAVGLSRPAAASWSRKGPRSPDRTICQCRCRQFGDRGLDLIAAFDQIDLVGILETMRALEYFRLGDVQGVVSQIARNKLTRILRSPESESAKKPTQKELAAAAKGRLQQARLAKVERNLELGKKLVALRAKTPNNRKFDHLRTRQIRRRRADRRRGDAGGTALRESP